MSGGTALATRQGNPRALHSITEQVPPHNLEAEQALIGAMLVAPDAITAARLHVDPAAFYGPQYGAAYQAICELVDAGHPPTPLAVADLLPTQAHDVLGGTDGLTRLLLDAPPTSSAPRLAEIIARDHRHRQRITLLGEISHHAYQRHDPPPELLEQLTSHHTLGDAHNLVTDDLATIWKHGTDVPPPVWYPVTGAQPLFYAGRIHDLHGEPNTGKTWVGYGAAADVLQQGHNIMWLDWEDNAETFLARLTGVGIPPDIATDPTRVRYLRPVGPLGPAELAHLHALCLKLQPALIIIDALAGALSTDGLDENSNSDVTIWGTRILRALQRHGPTIIVIDHVTRNPDTRTRGARGAGAKLAFYDGASYETTTTKSFSRQRAGEIRLKIAKDRPGHIGPVGHTAALITLTPGDDGTVELAARAGTTSTDEEGRFRPTHLMEKISRHLEGLGPNVELSKRQITDAVTGKNDYLRAAIDRLTEDGNLGTATREGRGGGTVYRLLAPYREPDQNGHDR